MPGQDRSPLSGQPGRATDCPDCEKSGVRLRWSDVDLPGWAGALERERGGSARRQGAQCRSPHPSGAQRLRIVTDSANGSSHGVTARSNSTTSRGESRHANSVRLLSMTSTPVGSCRSAALARHPTGSSRSTATATSPRGSHTQNMPSTTAVRRSAGCRAVHPPARGRVHCRRSEQAEPGDLGLHRLAPMQQRT